MLLKILILAVIAWFVLRAARNLLRAVAHDVSGPGSRPHDPSVRDGSGSDRTTVIHRRRQSGNVRREQVEQDEQDVEDARFRDL